MVRTQKLNLFAWALTTVAFCVAFLAWFEGNGWEIIGISTYQLFPLFGLTAFSVMWAHYIASVVRQIIGLEKTVLTQYFESTSLYVLIAICLHPGLLMWQLWRDGVGLPPGSVYSYVAPSLKWLTTLGLVSLLVFIAYEFRRVFEKKSWWKYVSYATDAAMLAIFFHGMRLGSILNSSWLRYVWIFYGVTLVLSLIYIHSKTIRVTIKSIE